MKTIALFGGSFDPPHTAHESIVTEALKINDVDKVVVMPTYLNPFKSSFCAPAELRMKWLKAIFSSYKNVEISSFEVDSNKKVPTIDSVKYLLKRYQNIYLIIGADNLKSLHMWEKYEELKDLVTFVIASRDNITIPNTFLKLTVEDNISSTQLRKNISTLKLSKVCSNEILQFYKEKN